MGQDRILAQGPPEEVIEPRRVGKVFGMEILVLRNPLSGRPYLIPKV